MGNLFVLKECFQEMHKIFDKTQEMLGTLIHTAGFLYRYIIIGHTHILYQYLLSGAK